MTDLTRVKCHNLGAVIRCARGRKRVRRGTNAGRTLSHFPHVSRDALSLPARQAATLSHFLHQKEKRSLTPAVIPREVRERWGKTRKIWRSVAKRRAGSEGALQATEASRPRSG